MLLCEREKWGQNGCNWGHSHPIRMRQADFPSYVPGYPTLISPKWRGRRISWRSGSAARRKIGLKLGRAPDVSTPLTGAKSGCRKCLAVLRSVLDGRCEAQMDSQCHIETFRLFLVRNQFVCHGTKANRVGGTPRRAHTSGCVVGRVGHSVRSCEK